MQCLLYVHDTQVVERKRGRLRQKRKNQVFELFSIHFSNIHFHFASLICIVVSYKWNDKVLLQENSHTLWFKLEWMWKKESGKMIKWRQWICLSWFCILLTRFDAAIMASISPRYVINLYFIIWKFSLQSFHIVDMQMCIIFTLFKKAARVCLCVCVECERRIYIWRFMQITTVSYRMVMWCSSMFNLWVDLL